MISHALRFVRRNPCPVCGGYDDAPRGKGVRCFGYLSTDGRYAHCTRSELAGDLPLHAESQTYAHRLDGSCRCGKAHGIATSSHTLESPIPRRRLAATYPYHDEQGTLLFEVVRRDPKGFSQRRPDGHGGWQWSLNGTRRVLYRLPELLAANLSRSVYIVEGEKDANRLASAGLTATTNPGGAGKWRSEYAEHLRGRPVVILPDNDEPGRRHAEQVARSLRGVATSIKIVELPDLPDRGDVYDWLSQGHSRDDLVALATQAPVWTPPPPSRNGYSAKTAPEYHLTDLGNARRLVAVHGADLRYTSGLGRLHYDGRRWSCDEIGEWPRRAKTVPEILRKEAAQIEVHDRRQGVEITAHADRSESRGHLEAMMELAQSEPGIVARPGDFDRDAWAFNTLSGTINLRTDELRPSRREDLITHLAPVLYDREAPCPRWQAFLERILPDRDVREFLQRLLGSSLVAGNVDQKITICAGSGANGKSTLAAVMRRVLGDYGATCDSSALLGGNDDAGPRPDLTRLAGVRLLFVPEIGIGRALDESLVKRMTGNDPLVARALYHEPFEFTPQFTPILFVNHLPTIRDGSHGMWRRVLQVPFDVTIPPEEQEPHLPDVLDGERSGILNWLLDGCLAWQRDGLNPPPAVLLATAEYRDMQDPLAEFVAARCILAPAFVTAAADLYRAYTAWADETGDRQPLGTRAFGMRLRERGLIRLHRRGGWAWRGVGLLGAPEETGLPILPHDDRENFLDAPVSGRDDEEAF